MTSTSSTAPIPAPDRADRDELGRLVGIVWHPATGGDAADRGRWLVAVDGSEGSMHALARAASLIDADPQAGIDLV